LWALSTDRFAPSPLTWSDNVERQVEMAAGGNGAIRRDVLVPAEWADFYEETRIPAAVRVGDTLRLTGHTGETDDGLFSTEPDGQIRQTFRNIAVTLAEGGATWFDVVELTSYHVGLRGQSDALLEVAAEFLEDPYPAWTAVGVTELFPPDAVVEISCIAVLPAKTE
jgi:enamine deaminase RidA (YjgF/YER057c/UK114 family)